MTVITAITANTVADERGKCLAAGMDDHICKPITKQQLANMLTKWITSEATFSADA
jgi:CheY-like chemotaxis protein